MAEISRLSRGTDASEPRVVLVVFDGLRPDFIDEGNTPHLHGFLSRGFWAAQARSVFPTLTRVCAATIITGCEPQAHGLMGNEVMMREPPAAMRVNTGDWRDLEKVARTAKGGLLWAETLHDLIGRAGGSTAVVSSGSSGSAYILSRLSGAASPDDGPPLYHPEIEGCEAFAPEVLARFGPPPPDTRPNTGRNAWCTRILTENVLPELAPRFTVFWHSDPDHTQDAQPLGSEACRAALAQADENFGRIAGTVEELRKGGPWYLMVASDHGHSTSLAAPDLEGLLAQAGLAGDGGEGQTAVARNMAGAMLYLDGARGRGAQGKAQELVRFLLEHEAVGPLFANRRTWPGPLPEGVHALDAIGHQNPRAADLVVSGAWSGEKNEYGVPGRNYKFSNPALPVSGCHGTASPYEMSATLALQGPGIRPGVVSRAPAGIVDLAPTVLRCLGLEASGGMAGRVLAEAWESGPAPEALKVSRRTDEVSAALGGVVRRQRLHYAAVEGVEYLYHGEVER